MIKNFGTKRWFGMQSDVGLQLKNTKRLQVKNTQVNNVKKGDINMSPFFNKIKGDVRMETIISSAITGGLALVGIILTNLSSNKKIEQQLDKAQAVTDCKIDTLTREVREHNNFAKRMPVVEEQIKVINHRISDLEVKINDR